MGSVGLIEDLAASARSGQQANVRQLAHLALDCPWAGAGHSDQLPQVEAALWVTVQQGQELATELAEELGGQGIRGCTCTHLKNKRTQSEYKCKSPSPRRPQGVLEGDAVLVAYDFDGDGEYDTELTFVV